MHPTWQITMNLEVLILIIATLHLAANCPSGSQQDHIIHRSRDVILKPLNLTSTQISHKGFADGEKNKREQVNQSPLCSVIDEQMHISIIHANTSAP